MVRSESKRSFCGTGKTKRDYLHAVKWQQFLAAQTEFEITN